MSQETPSRVYSIDILRGLAIFFMIVVHGGQSVLNTESLIAISGYYNIPSFIGGPIFMVVVGISFAISAERRKLKNNFKTYVYRRAFLLIYFQFLLNIVIFGVMQVWTYEVLILIGLSQLVCYYLMERSNVIKILFVLLTIFLTPIFKYLLVDQLELFTLFNPIWDLGKFFKAMIVTYPFAIFPYISYMVFGMMVGNVLVQARNNEIREREFCKNLIFYGLLLILLGLVFRIFNSPIINAFEEGLHVLLTTGLVMILLSGMYWLEDVKKIGLFRPLSLYGQISLTYLAGHHIINKYIFYYTFSILKNLSIYPYLILFTYMCVIFWTIAKFWSIINYKFSLGWIIRKLS